MIATAKRVLQGIVLLLGDVSAVLGRNVEHGESVPYEKRLDV